MAADLELGEIDPPAAVPEQVELLQLQPLDRDQSVADPLVLGRQPERGGYLLPRPDGRLNDRLSVGPERPLSARILPPIGAQ